MYKRVQKYTFASFIHNSISDLTKFLSSIMCSTKINMVKSYLPAWLPLEIGPHGCE